MPSAPKQDFQQEFADKRDKFMTNGTIHEEEDFEKPAAIEADIKDMEKRKRVSYIMNSDAFRAELENIIDYQLSHGPHPASVMALQHLADMLLPTNGAGPSTSTLSKAGGSVTPIADLRGVDASGYSKGERFLRCKLASLFRLLDQEGWADSSVGTTTHISARVSGEQDSVLINPSGLHLQEISATTLVKVDQHGNVMHPGSTTFGVSGVATSMHTALHRARPDVRCILHLKEAHVNAVSAMKHGLLRTGVDSCVLGNISTHPFFVSGGGALSDDVKESLSRELGAVNKVMLLSNLGAVVCGATIEETWQLTTNLVQACRSQLQCLQAAGGNVDNISLVGEDEAQKVFQSAWSGGDLDSEGGRQWKFGEMLFETKMRQFDNSGYRTGYIYKNPLIKVPTKPKFDVEVPPATSSMGYFSDSETLRATKNSRDRYIHSGGYERTEAEIFSDGDTPADKKTKIKWVRKDDTDLVVKIDGPHQFAPVITAKYELKSKINTMKDDRDLNKSNSGHTSRILDGLSDTDARHYQELQGSNPGAVAAFSKGIIQREHQKDAVILTDYTAQNPFDQVTDDELTTYTKSSARIAQGLPAEDPPSPVAAPEAQSRMDYQYQYQQRQQRMRYEMESSKKDKKNRAATMPHPPVSPSSPGGSAGNQQQVASDTESGLDKGLTTGGETENEATGTLDGKGSKKTKKTKSFKMPFGGGKKTK